MVRLVFRPYTQVRKAICTSAHLRASTRVSSGFALLRHSSPSFGSNRYARTQTFRRSSWSVDGAGTGHPTSQVTCASWVFHPPARIHVRLLGPCFKTGRLKAFRQHLETAVPEGQGQSSCLGPVGSIGRVTIPTFILPTEPMLAST